MMKHRIIKKFFIAVVVIAVTGIQLRTCLCFQTSSYRTAAPRHPLYKRLTRQQRSMMRQSVPSMNDESQWTSLETQRYDVSLLVVDHYDSFTYNLVDYLSQFTVSPPKVITKDEFDQWNPSDWKHIDGIILSPGPGRPQDQPVFTRELIQTSPQLPILGVCLGHQIMAQVYGATVQEAPVPIHGQEHWTTQHQKHSGQQPTMNSTMQSVLFDDIPERFKVVRYHSLAATNLPDTLTVTAKSDDDVIQAFQHNTNPHYGVQFHPESIGTEHGKTLLENFCRIVVATKKSSSVGNKRSVSRRQDRPHEYPSSLLDGRKLSSSSDWKGPFRVIVQKIDVAVSPEHAFSKFYSHKGHSIWLDSASAPEKGRFDILAAPSNPDDILTYHLGDSEDILNTLKARLFGTASPKWLKACEVAIISKPELDDLHWKPDTETTTELPFDYRGGFLGYMGYELRHATEFYANRKHGASSTAITRPSSNTRPTAAFFFARESLVFDHQTASWYSICVLGETDEVKAVLHRMKETEESLRSLEPTTLSPIRYKTATHTSHVGTTFKTSRSRDRYEEDIEKCHRLIKSGESYEICLTNKLETNVNKSLSTWSLYRILRRKNAAPYSSYLRWNMDQRDESSLAICSSSPERFMSVKKHQGTTGVSSPDWLQAESKPIKGTEARVIPANGYCYTDTEALEDEQRALSLQSSLKNRAENLMIVDLLRNDMSRVCDNGSVYVSELMAIESFVTVHQMVSTIRGSLSGDITCVDLLRASFPGGSMTGAPKIRTMELLEELEDGVERGPYSGSLGYLSVNGCMDMNIIIRSIVIEPGQTNMKLSIGAGGAITALSEVAEEYDEMSLKARAMVQATQDWVAYSHRQSEPESSAPRMLLQRTLNATATSVKG